MGPNGGAKPPAALASYGGPHSGGGGGGAAAGGPRWDGGPDAAPLGAVAISFGDVGAASPAAPSPPAGPSPYGSLGVGTVPTRPHGGPPMTFASMLEVGGGGAAAAGAGAAAAAAWAPLGDPAAGLPPPPVPPQELDTFVRASSSLMGSGGAASGALAQDPLMSYIYSSRVRGRVPAGRREGSAGRSWRPPCCMRAAACLDYSSMRAGGAAPPRAAFTCPLPSPPLPSPPPAGVHGLPLLRPQRRRRVGAHPRQQQRRGHAPLGAVVRGADHHQAHRRGQVGRVGWRHEWARGGAVRLTPAPSARLLRPSTY